jgi:glycerate kinase
MGSTFGTGLVLKELVLKNTGHITLFAGGTSTCDGGMGAAKALGLEFYNSRGMLLDPCGKNMLNVCTVKYAHQAMGFIKTLKNCALDFACDVNNPLSGPMGAASVYAPQKGASPDEVILLDRGLKNLESVISRFKDSLRLNKQGPEKSPAKSAAKGLASAIDEDTDAGINTETELESGMGMDADTGFEPGMGMGAAGGLALGLSAFFNINFVSGAQVIINKELIPFIKEADLIITGEGRLDSQSFYKKAQHTLLKTIKKLDKNKPVISINGQVEPNLNRPGKDTKGENIFFDSIHACLRCSKNGEHENNNLQKAGQNFAKQNLAEQRPAKQTLAKQSPAKQRLVRTAFQGLNAFFRKQNITKKD